MIDPTLPIDESDPDYSGDEMGYWPTYSEISSSSRAAYLEWLSGGRDNPEDNIGYVFLYFYGLERRLLIDRAAGSATNQEMQELFNEIKRLLKVYGKNRSFNSYAINFLSHLWIINGAKGDVSDELLIFNNYFSPVFQYLLAKTVNDGKAVPPNLAFAWVKGNPEFRLRTPARRCAEEFRKLFEKRYIETFEPNGLVIKPNKTKLTLSYTPASSSLCGYSPIKLDLPDPTRLKSQAKKLCELAEKCIDELDPYSRFLGRKGNSRDSISAIAQLPIDLISDLKINKIEALSQYLKNKVTDQHSTMTVESLLETIGDENLYKLNKKECETIAFLIDATGFGLAPDIRYHGAKLEASGSVVIFTSGHLPDFKPSNDFRIVGTILRLGAIVAKIDGEVSEPEVKFLKKIINSDSRLTEQEKKSLTAYLHWRLAEPVNAKGLKAQLNNLKSKEKSAIGNILINVAYADGYIDPAEVKQLEKLYTSLGLEKESVAKDINMISAQEKTESEDVEQISRVKKQVPHDNLIDMERLRKHEAETEDVKAILGNIFAEPDVEDEKTRIVTPPASQPETTDILGELDEAHQLLFREIVIREEWKREDVQVICEQNNLMIDGSIETINDWAFEHVDAPLIEEGELIYVDLELANEITTMNA